MKELDLFGPAEVFSCANRVLYPERPAYQVEIASAGTDRIVYGELGVSFSVQKNFREISGEVDSLLVTSGYESRMARNPEFFAWMKRVAPNVRRIGSICVAAFQLAEAGFLEGRRATTHWIATQELATRYPNVSVDPEPIWVRDGKVYTSAGITSGIDLALEWVGQDHGNEVALNVARRLVVFLRRPGGQAQFSASLATQAPESKSLHELQVWMTENIHRKLSVDRLAARVAMSPRNFARAFQRELGITPAQHIQKLRLESARRLLQTTDRGLEEIARICGFGSAEIMRRAFQRSFQTTPKMYRDHFGKPNSL